jgi:hypothetical protein
MKYRKKPVVIKAVQWDGFNLSKIRHFCPVCKSEICDTAWEAGVGAPVVRLIIPTLEGDMEASKGDYIIKGVNGEFYPCKPDIFDKSYELVEEDTSCGS